MKRILYLSNRTFKAKLLKLNLNKWRILIKFCHFLSKNYIFNQNLIKNEHFSGFIEIEEIHKKHVIYENKMQKGLSIALIMNIYL